MISTTTTGGGGLTVDQGGGPRHRRNQSNSSANAGMMAVDSPQPQPQSSSLHERLVPVMAAVHPNQIHAMAMTSWQGSNGDGDASSSVKRFLFTGSQVTLLSNHLRYILMKDGFVRRWDTSFKNPLMLTGTQKHGLVDSIQKAAQLMGAWENDDDPPRAPPPSATAIMNGGGGQPMLLDNNPLAAPQQPPLALPPGQTYINSGTEPGKNSPVYSIDVHDQGVWCVGGTEAGNINLWSVRHEEGKLQHVFKGHSKAVSALKILPGQKQLASASWDTLIKIWDLDNGACIREFNNSKSQITSLTTTHPASASSGSPSDSTRQQDLILSSSIDGSVFIHDLRNPQGLVCRFDSLPHTPPWTLSACWNIDGTKIFTGRRNCCVDEFDFRMTQRLSRCLKLPSGSGIVSAVYPLSGNNLLIASFDNIRIWDLDYGGANSGYEMDLPDYGTSFKTTTEGDGIDNNNPANHNGVNGLGDLDLFGGPQGDNNSFEFSPLGTSAPQQPRKSISDNLAMLEDDLQAPTVPFSLVPGHHGGVISSLCVSDNLIVSSSGNRGYEGHANNLCLFYSRNQEK